MFEPSAKSHVRFRAVGAFIAIALLSVGAMHTAGAAQSGLAYDELTKLQGGDQPAPQPGTFNDDFQAAVDAANAAANAPQHHGLFGGIQNAAEKARGALEQFKTGFATRLYFMNGWERIDSLATQTATITKPNLHQVIQLDLAKKTYQITDTSAQPMTQTQPYQPPGPPGPPPPSPQPGTGKLDIRVSTAVLGPKTIDTVSTTGYSVDFKATETKSTGSCTDGTFETSVVEYLSSYAEPQMGPTSHAKIGPMPKLPMGSPMGLKAGCSPTTTMHASGGASEPSGRLSLWTFVTLKGSAQTSQGSAGGGFSTLIERGHVRALGAADASLFEIPSDFTKAQ